jgi:hypothetical protein
MNEVHAFPQITKRKFNKSLPPKSKNNSSYKSSYMQHLTNRKKSKSPIRDSLLYSQVSSIKRSRLPPLPKLSSISFSDPTIQEKYLEIKSLLK